VRHTLLIAMSLGLAACQGLSGGGGAEPAPASGPLEEARAQYEAGHLDAALAKCLGLPATDARSLSLQGLVWTKKAEAAPVPTPDALAPGSRPPEFKAEELRAIDLFERARAADAQLAEAPLGLANLLAPHAVRRHEMTAATRKRAAASRAQAAGSASTDGESGPDFSVARVAGLYRTAAQAEGAGTTALQEYLRFAQRLKDVDSIEWALNALIERDRENPENLVQFADFLQRERKDRHRAIDYYRQALIWRADDVAIKGKLADLYIQLGREHFDAAQWAAALTMFQEAQKYLSDRSSAQAIMVKEHLSQLESIRQGR
jgi:tetratricopeptide (TPR) repeat protein